VVKERIVSHQLGQNQRMPVTIAIWLLLAVLLAALGQIFGLNGSQWDWWRWGCFAAAVLGLCGAVYPPLPLRAARGLSKAGVLTAGACGTGVAAATIVVMSTRYSDPYDGPLFWPHLLAVLAVLGFVTAAWAEQLLTRPSS